MCCLGMVPDVRHSLIFERYYMLICALDVETTGLSAKTDRITEVGFVVWNTETWSPVVLKNTNHIWPDMPVITDEITKLTGITQEHLDDFSVQDNVSEFFYYAMIMVKFPVCVAHNAPFDRGFMDKAFELCGLIPPDITWLDTSVDVPYPQEIKTRKLIHLCAEHGINPNSFAHRGLFDILKTMELLGKYDFDECLARAKTPNVTVKGVVSAPWQDPKPEGKKDNDIAKANGFRWHGETKSWIRVCKATEVETIRKIVSFPIEVINE